MNPFVEIDAQESDYLFIQNSQIKGAGLGLFTAIAIFKDEIISVFKGELLSQSEADKRAKSGENAYFIQMLDGTIMDSMHKKCFAKYANDSQGFIKSKLKINSNICLNENDAVCIVAKKNIKAGEEIFCSYGRKYWMKYKK